MAEVHAGIAAEAGGSDRLSPPEELMKPGEEEEEEGDVKCEKEVEEDSLALYIQNEIGSELFEAPHTANIISVGLKDYGDSNRADRFLIEHHL
ncbi:hypothetical protein T265_11329 [Opisthorchis viverrini]|uniref:Uncharacterized protein n=1 Tax=Opisthorchis viverrini TaxID=6198 RepID=A0A074Z9V6_OPIVI|nr:hypothetical protein T265_11329 [Opisthorchis viverrini]KER20025.1 hypothetical protein T265_11329 [Opisthorchis viverrini]